MDERDYKAMNEELNQSSILGDVINPYFLPQDFKIGNYITSRCWKGNHKIQGIEVLQNRIDFKVQGYIHSQVKGQYFELDKIPLTAAWLVGFGYTKKESSVCNQWWNGLNDITHDWLVDITEMLDDKTFFYRNAKHPIKYVHELQNLHYMLSGEMPSLR